MNKVSRTTWFYLAAGLFFLVFLLPFGGGAQLFDWDEIIFAEAAREMIFTGDYLTVQSDFEPFYEKPPLFIWMQVLSMKAFGINEFAARFPNAVCGLLTILLLFLAGRRLRGPDFGMRWSFAHALSLLPFFYFNTGIIDPWFNLFIFLGIICFILFLNPERTRRRHLLVLLSAFSLGLAVLTKGPVAILIFTLCFIIFLFVRRPKISVRFSHVALFTLVLVISGGWWYLAQLQTGNFGTVKEFISYQAGLFTSDFAGHSGFPGYHFIILMFGVFPASVFFFSGLTAKMEATSLTQIFKVYMYILLALILVLFSIVETKLVHYSSLAYFPITFLAAMAWDDWIQRKVEIRRWQRALFGFILSVFVMAAVALPVLGMAGKWELLPGLTDDPFVRASLSGDLGIRWYSLLPALLLLSGGITTLRWLSIRDTRALPSAYITTFAFTFTALMIFIPVAERITQDAAVTFFREKANEDVHLETLGYKSFAQLFYGKKDLYMKENGLTKEMILEGKSDREAYFVIKADKKDRYLQRYPNLTILYEKNGYTFTHLP